MSITLYVNFPEAAHAEKALGALIDHGARKQDLTAFFPARYFRQGTDATDVEKAVAGITTTTAEDAAEGANKGVKVGLGIGVLAALASLAIPGFGLVTGGSALTTALWGLVGATAGGAVAGGVAGFLKDQGVSERIAVDSEAAIQNGRALIIVSCPPEGLCEEEARKLLVKYRGIEFGREEIASIPAAI